MLVDRDDDLFGRKPQLLGGGVEDALVGLVRHDPIDLVGAVSGDGEHLVEDVRQVHDRMAKHFLALHAKLADRAGVGNAAIDIEENVMAALGGELGGEKSLNPAFYPEESA